MDQKNGKMSNNMRTRAPRIFATGIGFNLRFMKSSV